MSDKPPTGRAAVLTPAGRGAIAVVAAQGNGALAAVDAAFRAANGRSIREQPIDCIIFGQWRCQPQQPEDVIVVRGSEDEIEIHCHGGVAAVERVMAALAGAGCAAHSQGQWRATECESLLVAEADEALAGATTQRAAMLLLEQRGGALRLAVEKVQRDLAAGNANAARSRLAALLARAPLGLRLAQPWQAAIAGLPNVGKSSLLNALVGYQRAIIYDLPGTTRDVLAANTAVDGWPVRLTDGAGIRSTDDPLEAEGVDRARRRLAQADLALWVLDGGTLVGSPQAAAEREWNAIGASPSAPEKWLIVVNKSDLMTPPEHRDGAIFVSALTGAGLNELLTAVGRRLVPSPPQRGEGVPFTVRQTNLLERALQALDAGALFKADAALAELVG